MTVQDKNKQIAELENKLDTFLFEQTDKANQERDAYRAHIRELDAELQAFVEAHKVKALQNEAAHEAAVSVLEEDTQRGREKIYQAIAQLQQERDAIALAEKLKLYPVELVEGHKTCSLCGAEMRPFHIFKDGASFRYWGCQTSQPNHDYVEVKL